MIGSTDTGILIDILPVVGILTDHNAIDPETEVGLMEIERNFAHVECGEDCPHMPKTLC